MSTIPRCDCLALLATRSRIPCSMDFAMISSVQVLRVRWLRSRDCAPRFDNFISTHSLNSFPSTTLSILRSYRSGSSSRFGSPFSSQMGDPSPVLHALRITSPSRMIPALGICFGHTRPVHQRPQDHEYHPQHEHVRIEAMYSYQQRVLHRNHSTAFASRFHNSLARVKAVFNSLGIPLAVS